MTVNTANALFMVSLAIFSAVAAAALAVVFEQWWNRRQVRQARALEDVADKADAVGYSMQKIADVLNKATGKENDRG